MSKKVTLEFLAGQLGVLGGRLEFLAGQMAKGFATLGKRIDKVEKRIDKVDKRVDTMNTSMERHFIAIVEDMATKDHIIALHTQVNSIEMQLRGHSKLQSDVDDLKEKVFGTARR